MGDVSPAQVATRRRALGRKMIRYGSDAAQLVGGLEGSTDFQFLTDPERKMVDKLLANMGKVSEQLDSLGTRLEAGQ